MRDWLRRAVTPELEVLDEVDWYLDGTLLTHRRTRPARMPPWAWISVLAHGDPDALADLAAPEGRDHVVAPWPLAVSFLAGETLDVAGRQAGAVRALQRSVLIPAELRFLERSARGGNPGPEQFATEVLAELEEQRSAGPRPGA
jgi:hypothetical protein